MDSPEKLLNSGEFKVFGEGTISSEDYLGKDTAFGLYLETVIVDAMKLCRQQLADVIIETLVPVCTIV